MDSVLSEDTSLPVDFEKSANPGQLQEVTLGTLINFQDDPSSITEYYGGGGRQLSPLRARTMKEYDTQLSNLRKENFHLKLRIYFLEERMQSGHGPNDDQLAKTNIELKVEVETLRNELAGKQELLVKASKALETLESQYHAETTQLRQQHEASRRSMERKIGECERELEMLHEREQRRRRRSSDQIPAEVLAQALQRLEDPSKAEIVELTTQVQELEDIVTRLNQDLKESQSRTQEIEEALQEKEKQAKTHEEMSSKRDKTIQGLLETVYTRCQEINRLKDKLESKENELKALKGELNKTTKTARGGLEDGEVQEVQVLDIALLHKIIRENVQKSK